MGCVVNTVSGFRFETNMIPRRKLEGMERRARVQLLQEAMEQLPCLDRDGLPPCGRELYRSVPADLAKWERIGQERIPGWR